MNDMLSRRFYSLPLALTLGCVLLGQQSASHPAAKAPADSAAATDETTVLTVGAQKITAKQLDAIIEHLPAQSRGQALSHKREVAEQYGQMLALVQEAERRHLDSSTDFKMQMMMTRNSALANSLVQSLRDEVKISDADERAYYTGHPTEFEQVRARHILVSYAGVPGSQTKRTKDEAKAKADALEARLKKGEDFAAIVKAESDDPGSKDKGGEYTFGHGQMVPEFDKLAWSLPVGQLSEPFETRYGYHILQVEERKPVPFDQAKSSIEQKLNNDAVQKKMNDIMQAAHPTLNESYFASATGTGNTDAGPGKPATPSNNLPASGKDQTPTKPQ
jgi:parvulin-like peptidyl-prolyl isomerase